MHVKSSLQRASGASTAGRGCQKAIDVVDRFFHDLLDKELLFFLALPDVVDKEGLAVGIRACRPRAALKVCPGRGPALHLLTKAILLNWLSVGSVVDREGL